MGNQAWLGLPPRYVVVSILTSIGGLLLGVDTGIIGPVTVMESYAERFGHQSATVHGIVVSSILLSASVSSFCAGWPADAFGRPRALAFGAAIFGLGAAIQAGSVSLAMFIVGRVIEGVGEGLYFGTQTVYICEISPPRIRGRLTTGPQFLICTGLVLGYFTCYGTSRLVDSLSWRVPFIMLAALSAAYVAICLTLLPNSPRWLALHDRKEEAERNWKLLGIKDEDQSLVADDEQAAEQINVRDQVQQYGAAERDSEKNREPYREPTFRDMFAPDVRGRTTLAVFLMGMLQLSGIDAVLYYAPLLFQQAGLQSSQASFLASGVSGLVVLAVSVPALLFADNWGRRTSTLVGGVGLTTTMILIGGLYAANAVKANTGAGRWVVIVSIYFYAAFFATTWAVSIKVYAPEIQPQRTRAQAVSLAHGVNWVGNFFVAFICPILLDRSSYGAYFLFGGCTALTTVVCFLFMIETKGRSLDDIEEIFNAEPGSRIWKPWRRGDALMNQSSRATHSSSLEAADTDAARHRL